MYNPAARIVPAAIVPTLMYSRPVADSIDRSCRLDRRPAHDQREDQAHEQAQPDEQGHGPTSAANAGVPS